MIKCTICQCEEENDKVRHHDIYVIGSEGVYLCYKCEMAVVTFLRDMQYVSMRTMLYTLKKVKKSNE